VADSIGVKKAKPRKRNARPSPRDVVAHMLSHLGPVIGRKADEYVHLGVELEAYLRFRGDACGWDRLDVRQFIGAYEDREMKIRVCCNLAAVLCWIELWAIPSLDLPGFYDALLEVCPADDSAHAYIRWGGQRARGLEDEPPAEVLAAHRRAAS
jgi:hypothetical protein